MSVGSVRPTNTNVHKVVTKEVGCLMKNVGWLCEGNTASLGISDFPCSLLYEAKTEKRLVLFQ